MRRPAVEKRTRFVLNKIMAIAVITMMFVCCSVIPSTDESEATGTENGVCGSNLSWSYNSSSGHLTITGYGEMYNFSINSLRWGGNLIKTVSFPEGMTSIGSYAFSGCTFLESITIPSTVLTIGAYSFIGCYSLESVTIPDSVTTMENDSFYNCYNLKNINLGANVAMYGRSFRQCPNIEQFNVSESNPNYRSVDGVLFNKTVERLIYYPAKKTDTTYTVPNTVTDIMDNAFSYSSNLVTVTLPSNLNTISHQLFQHCNKLTTITIPDGVTSIGTYAILDCDKLTSITIPKSVTTIDELAIIDCPCLKTIDVSESNPNYRSVDGVLFNKSMTTLISYPAAKDRTSYSIPDGVVSICPYSFENCKNLSSITIPDGVTSISNSLFKDCTNLKSIIIPNTVTSIDCSAFHGCNSLTTLTLPSGLSSFTNTMWPSIKEYIVPESNPNYRSVDGVLFNKSMTTLISYPAAKDRTSYSIPDGVVSIESGAFYNCYKLKTITIPSSTSQISNLWFQYGWGVRSVTNSCFAAPSDHEPILNGCPSLAEIIVSESNPYYCSVNGVLFNKTKTALIRCPPAINNDITIPDSVTTINNNAFSCCSNIKNIMVSDNNSNYRSVNGVLYTKDMSVLVWCPSGYSGSLYVPDDDNFISLQSISFCKGISEFITENKNFKVINGALYWYDVLIAYPSGNSAESFVLPAVTKPFNVDVPTFYECENLKEILVEEKVTAFSSINGCLYNKDKTTLIVCPSGKTEFTLPSSTTDTMPYSFSGNKLETVTFSSETNVILNKCTFFNCRSLNKIVIEEGANVSFEENSIFFDDNKEHTIHVIAPDNFVLDTSRYGSNIKIVYGEQSDNNGGDDDESKNSNKGNNLFIYIGIGAIGVAAAVTIAIIIIRRH